MWGAARLVFFPLCSRLHRFPPSLYLEPFCPGRAVCVSFYEGENGGLYILHTVSCSEHMLLYPRFFRIRLVMAHWVELDPRLLQRYTVGSKVPN